MTTSPPTAASPLRIVIVGGVAGGASAATRARRVNAQAEITLLEKGSRVRVVEQVQPLSESDTLD